MNIVSELISSYIDALYQEPDKDLMELRDFAEANHVPIIKKDTEEFLRLLLSLQKPKRILEIGTAIGYSACFFAKTCGAHVTTIEREKDLYWTACSNIRQLNCTEKIMPLNGEAQEILREMNTSSIVAAEDGFDFIFIDAAKRHYNEFWELCVPLCADDAIIVCNNVLMRGLTALKPEHAEQNQRTSIRNMREFLQMVKEIPYADTCVLTVSDGLSISRIDREIYEDYRSSRQKEKLQSVSYDVDICVPSAESKGGTLS